MKTDELKESLIEIVKEMLQQISVRCKYCGSLDVVRNGSYRQVQRYLCRKCGRGFSYPSHLPRMRFSMEIMAGAIDGYISGMSLHETSRNLEQTHGIGISHDSVYQWIKRYVPISLNEAKKHPHKFGDTWIADETVIRADKKLWLHVVLDAKTRFVLATHLSPTRTIGDAKILFAKANEVAQEVIPKEIITDGLKTYIEAIEDTYGADTTHTVSSPFGGKVSTSLVERWHGTLKDRTKSLRGLARIRTAQEWFNTFVHDYNYFRPHESLGGKTPSEVAGVKFPFKNWLDVVRSQAYPMLSQAESGEIGLSPKARTRVIANRKRKRKTFKIDKRDKPTTTLGRMG